MNWKELNLQLKNNNISNAYVFTGTEAYLCDFYKQQFVKKIVGNDVTGLNLFVFEGEKLSIKQIAQAVEGYPVFAEKKLIIFKDTGIFKKSEGELFKYLEGVFLNMPDYLYILFIEPEIDKRKKVYKSFSKIVQTVEFNMMELCDLKSFITKNFSRNNKSISEDVLSYFIESCDNSMYSILREIEKLSCFDAEKNYIDKKQIDMIVTKSVENRIFELADSLTRGNKQKALSLLADLKLLKEPQVRIMSLISAQFCGIYYAKTMQKNGMSIKDIAKKLGKMDFVVKKYLALNISEEKLEEVIKKCDQADLDLKSTSFYDKYLPIEMLIVSI